MSRTWDLNDKRPSSGSLRPWSMLQALVTSQQNLSSASNIDHLSCSALEVEFNCWNADGLSIPSLQRLQYGDTCFWCLVNWRVYACSNHCMASVSSWVFFYNVRVSVSEHERKTKYRHFNWPNSNFLTDANTSSVDRLQVGEVVSTIPSKHHCPSSSNSFANECLSITVVERIHVSNQAHGIYYQAFYFCQSARAELNTQWSQMKSR